MAAILLHAVQLITIVAAPLLLFTLIIHQLEKFSQRRLAERFGWHSVLWTGWLGTPIHELSHAALCVVFRHRIDDMALFEPDYEAGRLGYVRHSYNRGNRFEELGNLFIGLAPLAGGSLALATLLWLFFPAALNAAVSTAVATDSIAVSTAEKPVQPGGATVMTTKALVDRTLHTTQAVCSQVFTVENLSSARFWWFLYLVLCVGSHMAPSRSDYAGARTGLVWFLIVVLIAGCSAVALAKAFQRDPSEMVQWTLEWISPVLALLMLAASLCLIATAAIHAITWFFPVRYHVR